MERIEVALAIVLRGGRALVSPREEGSHLEGLWEFPGGKIEAGEDPVAAASRELLEETGLRAKTLEPLTVFIHTYPDRTVRLHVFLARDAEGDPASPGGRAWSFVALSDLEALPMPEANRAILRALSWRTGRP